MTDIKVGDTVRITHGALAYAGDAIGETFQVTGITGTGHKRGQYATGYPGGVYLIDLELVKSVDDPRWRYNDHIVVYPETRDANGPGRGVTVLDETPLPKIYTRWENRPEAEGDEITAAARAYWEAHPLPKPAWHDPHADEAWELTVNGDTGAFVVVYRPWLGEGRAYLFQAGNGTLVDYMSGDITAGRRIYPEPTE